MQRVHYFSTISCFIHCILTCLLYCNIHIAHPHIHMHISKYRRKAKWHMLYFYKYAWFLEEVFIARLNEREIHFQIYTDKAALQQFNRRLHWSYFEPIQDDIPAEQVGTYARLSTQQSWNLYWQWDTMMSRLVGTWATAQYM